MERKIIVLVNATNNIRKSSHIYSHTSPFAYSVKNNSMKGSLN